MSEKEIPKPDQAEKPVMLEDVITALQKTFSRVSSTTQKNVLENPDYPTARLGSLVDFEATVSLAPHDIDHLKVADGGCISLLFKGQIQNDIEYVVENKAATEPQPSPPNNAR